MQVSVLPVFLLMAFVAGLAVVLILVGYVFNPGRPTPVKRMPYESGMDPLHDTRRRFDVRYYLVAIAFLVFDVEILFLYPWAVVFRSGPAWVFGGGMVFLALLALGFIYDWKKGIFHWR
ncbi:MAG TPA: NADH-quinone oxidoreductase subunit A [Planctomycetaceae bacterium]|nr:NADH-quinone oxidoreductase subunit A [Planctomycetaceae bacterium]HIQ20859.1 NADH-quinone oxidoreductase subunit A [Planctomycetota bacterium]